MSKEQVSIKIVHMNQEHMGAVENIENTSFDHPWSYEELEAARKKRYYLARVALVTPKGSRRKILAGSMFVELDKFRFTILSIATHPDWRRLRSLGRARCGVGTAFLQYLIKRLRDDGRSEIYELVRETNLTAQKFYRAAGFIALRPKPNAFCETDEDAYPMLYKWEWSPQGQAINGIPDNCSKRNHFCTGCGDCE